jgi:F5/8 type C domain/IPT/TIG domain
VIQTSVPVTTGTNTRNFALRRDWAAKGGGGVVTAFNGPDYTVYGCGPSAAIDQSLGSGWGSDTAGGAKFMVVRLPISVNLTTFAVDPGATCGDPDSASVKGYKIETSPNGTTWTQAAAGNFGAANNHKLNTVTPSAGKTNVRYVRFTMLSTQGTNQFMDMSELEVYGLPTVTPSISGFTPTSGRTGSSVTINGVGFAGANGVWFGGVKATTFTATASSITATVPNGAVTGKIAVRTLGGTVFSPGTYTVTLSIRSFTPTSGPAGTTVTINGLGFTPSAVVKFNGTTASKTYVSPTQLKAVVPAAATTGKITVTTAAGTVQSPLSFTKT